MIKYPFTPVIFITNSQLIYLNYFLTTFYICQLFDFFCEVHACTLPCVVIDCSRGKLHFHCFRYSLNYTFYIQTVIAALVINPFFFFFQVSAICVIRRTVPCFHSIVITFSTVVFCIKAIEVNSFVYFQLVHGVPQAGSHNLFCM